MTDGSAFCGPPSEYVYTVIEPRHLGVDVEQHFTGASFPVWSTYIIGLGLRTNFEMSNFEGSFRIQFR
jgi:hypothetical protein